MQKIGSFLFLFLLIACTSNKKPVDNSEETKKLMHETVLLNIDQVNRLVQLPLKCMQQEFPNKLSQTLGTKDELGTPKELHPAFYGCFDWHSSVHGHWMLVKLLKMFPNLDEKEEIIDRLVSNLSAQNIQGEVAYFQRESEKSYERTYGWAWLLKLAEELHTWDSDLARELEANLHPLTNLIIEKYLDYLPRLNYPIRVGEHTNTAFGMAFALDYCNTVGNALLKALIEKRAKDFYLADAGCPLTWEPSGYDFLSPCLEEADIMRRYCPKTNTEHGLQLFCPNSPIPISHGSKVKCRIGAMVKWYI